MRTYTVRLNVALPATADSLLLSERLYDHLSAQGAEPDMAGMTGDSFFTYWITIRASAPDAAAAHAAETLRTAEGADGIDILTLEVQVDDSAERTLASA